MTDKEWYAQVSTLVLEGIEQVNRGSSPWANQQNIKRLVNENKTPGMKRAERIQFIKGRVLMAAAVVGYALAGLMLVIGALAWIVCAEEGMGFEVPERMAAMAAVLAVVGFAAQTWNELP